MSLDTALYVAVKKLQAILLSATLLAACGTAASSTDPTGAGDRTSANSVRVSQIANADSELDVNLTNPPINKVVRPTPTDRVRPQTVTPNALQPQTRQDRCTAGAEAGTGLSPRGATPFSGKQPLPMCLSE